MATILLIETSADVCSVALSVNGKIVAVKESAEGKNHASNITLYIEEVMKLAGIQLKNIDAVAVNGGPGSYTGLRIGLSTAKGLCFALDKPLIIIDALQALGNGLLSGNTFAREKIICPVIDNRRDEIFFAFLNSEGLMIKPIELVKTTDSNFLDYIKDKQLVFTGSGIEKVRNALTSNSEYIPILPSAEHLLPTSDEKYLNNDFANLAYSEPLYYKGVYIN